MTSDSQEIIHNAPEGFLYVPPSPVLLRQTTDVQSICFAGTRSDQ